MQRLTVRPSCEILIPYERAQPGSPIAPAELHRSYPKAGSYLARFHHELVRRPRFRNFNPAVGTPWELYGVNRYSFASAKVVWREQATNFTVAVALPVLGRPVMIDHKLVAVGLEDVAEACYLAAVLNSVPVRVLVDSYALELSLSSHVLDYVAVPRYDPGNADHAELARLGAQAATAQLPGGLTATATAIDVLAARLWGLQPDAVTALQRFHDDLPLAATDPTDED